MTLPFSRTASAKSNELAFLRHELCQPLTYLSTSLGIIRKRLDQVEETESSTHAPALRALAAAQEAVAHLVEIVRRIGAAEAHDEVGPVDLAELVLSTLLMVEEELGARADLVRDIACRPVVLGNRTRLRQVLLNLLTNAVLAVDERGPERGAILVRVTQVDEGVVALVVRDNGVGISPSAQKRIGEPNFTTRPGRGSGLGLTLSREIVETYGGTLGVQGDLENGTTAQVLLRVAVP